MTRCMSPRPVIEDRPGCYRDRADYEQSTMSGQRRPKTAISPPAARPTPHQLILLICPSRGERQRPADALRATLLFGRRAD